MQAKAGAHQECAPKMWPHPSLMRDVALPDLPQIICFCLQGYVDAELVSESALLDLFLLAECDVFVGESGFGYRV